MVLQGQQRAASLAQRANIPTNHPAAVGLGDAAAVGDWQSAHASQQCCTAVQLPI